MANVIGLLDDGCSVVMAKDDSPIDVEVFIVSAACYSRLLNTFEDNPA